MQTNAPTRSISCSNTLTSRQSLEKEYPKYRAHIRNAIEAGQFHIFRWWNEISAPEKEALLEQVASIDFQFIHTLFCDRLKKKTAHAVQGLLTPPQIIPVPANAFEKEIAQEAKRIGENSLRKGEFAILTVAGGDATRLGADKPKGTLSIAPISGKSIFQLQAEKIRTLQQKYCIKLHWYLMTSENNNRATQNFFHSHHFFGLDPRHVHFFTQRMLPVIDLKENLLMNSRSSILMSPNGHGGAITALKEKHILDEMKSLGIKNIFYHQIDNVLTKIADPIFIGYHLKNKADMSLKIVKKRHPEEKVGVVGRIDGHLHMIEYSELRREDMYARNEDGTLKYNAGNIAVHIISIDFLERIYREGDALPYHAAVKKAPYLNENGNTISPERENAVKFECFIFDILKQVKNGVVMEVLREEEFSPVKNMEGENSPSTVKQDLINLFGRWLRNAGISIPTDAQGNVVGLIEISPCFAMDEEELKSKVDKDLKFNGSLNL